MRIAATPHRSAVGARGFTLIELCIVILLIGVLMAVAMPRFLPAISYSSLEGAALHLGHYGRAAMAQAVLSRQLITVYIDLDKQQYKTVRKKEEVVTTTSSSSSRKETGASGTLGTLLKSAMGQSSASSALSNETQDKAEQMQIAFDNFTRLALQARAKNVEQEGILSDIGPLFEKEFKLNPKEEEKQYEEVTTPLLQATALPDNVQIESVRYSGKVHTKGLVKIDITPLGLSEPVQIYLRGENGVYYSVMWDAITGEAIVAEGKQNLQ